MLSIVFFFSTLILEMLGFVTFLFVYVGGRLLEEEWHLVLS